MNGDLDLSDGFGGADGFGGEGEFGGGPADAVTELAAALFPVSLRRKDHRRKGEQYVRGLLTVGGRKTMRNIASLIGGSAAEQSLQHFISSSTWDWAPVREALAAYVQRTVPPQAWVVQQMTIPKAGDHSVGVDAGSYAGLGGQQAFGVWFASEELSVPVNWRLYLPPCWLQDMDKRRRADIPDETVWESLEECAAATVLAGMSRWRVPRRPVLLNAAGLDVRVLVRAFGSAGVPVLARIAPTTRLTVADAAMPGFGAGMASAQQIVDSVKGLRRPVGWDGTTSLVVGVRVELPGAGGRTAGPGPRRLLLLGEWHDPRRPPTELLLTDMTDAPAPALLRLSRLSRRVARDFTEVGDRVGLRDFEGRSFRGWHRHTTLASMAHTAALLGDTGWDGRPMRGRGAAVAR